MRQTEPDRGRERVCAGRQTRSGGRDSATGLWPVLRRTHSAVRPRCLAPDTAAAGRLPDATRRTVTHCNRSHPGGRNSKAGGRRSDVQLAQPVRALVPSAWCCAGLARSRRSSRGARSKRRIIAFISSAFGASINAKPLDSCVSGLRITLIASATKFSALSQPLISSA